MGDYRRCISCVAMALFAASFLLLVLERYIFFLSSGALLVGATLFAFVDVAFNGLGDTAKKVLRDQKNFFIAISVLYGAMVLAAFFSPVSIASELVRGHMIFLSNVAAFLLVLIYGVSLPLFFRFIYGLFFVPLVLIPFLYIVDFDSVLVAPEFFFQGFTGNASHFTFFLIVPTTGIFTFFILAKRRLDKIIFLLLGVFSTAMLLWAGSRVGWLGLFVGLLFVAVAASRQEGRPWYFVKYFGAALFIILLGFMVLSTKAKVIVLSRVNLYSAQKVAMLHDRPQAPVTLERKDFSVDIRHAINPSGRIAIWRQAVQAFSKRPFGYGPAHLVGLPLFNESEPDPKSTHNIFLETALSGGIIGLVAFVGLLFLVLRRIFSLLSGNAPFVLSGIAASLGGILLGFMVGSDGLYLRWLWVLMALFFVAEYQRKKKSGTI